PVSRRPSGRPGALRFRLQPDPGQLPGQRDHRAAHRKLRVLAGGQGWAGPAARGYALELGDAAVGRLPHRARDLVGDPLPVRSDRLDTTDLGKNGKRDAGCGRRAMSPGLLIAAVALTLA